MKIDFMFILKWALTAVIVWWLVIFLSNEKDKFSLLLTVNSTYISVLILSCIISSILNGLSRKLMTMRLGFKLSFMDWYGLTMVTNLMSFFIPARGDLVFSATYLKKRYGLSITNFGSITYGNAILSMAILFFVGCVGILLFGLIQGVWFPVLCKVIIVLGIAVFCLSFFPSRFFTGEKWIVKRLRIFLEGWETLRSDHLLLIKLALLTVAGYLVFAINTYISYTSLGFKVSFFSVILVSIVIQMSFFASITPGNLGVRETITGFVSYVVGVGFTQGVTVSILQRVVSIVVFSIIGGLFSLFIVRSMHSDENNE